MSKARELAALGNAYSDGALSNRNLIINGAMQVAQRGTSVSGSSANGYHTVDRWRQIVDSGAGSFTLSASTDAPSGFSNSEKIEITTGGSKVTALTSYLFEGQDLQRLGFGTASASPVTLSFWVKSNVVGTYTAELYNATSVRQVSKTYSVGASGVWEYKEITFPADTSNGFANNNTTGMYLFFWKQAASTFTGGTLNTSAWAGAVDANRVNASIPHFTASAGNYFQITGVQLEVGDTATPFEHRLNELVLCQRYFERFTYPSGEYRPVALGHWYSTSGVHAPFYYSEKRTTPTASVSNANHFGVYVGTSLDANYATTLNLVQLTSRCLNLNPSTLATGSVGTVNAASLISKMALYDAWIDIDAEL